MLSMIKKKYTGDGVCCGVGDGVVVTGGVVVVVGHPTWPYAINVFQNDNEHENNGNAYDTARWTETVVINTRLFGADIVTTTARAPLLRTRCAEASAAARRTCTTGWCLLTNMNFLKNNRHKNTWQKRCLLVEGLAAVLALPFAAMEAEQGNQHGPVEQKKNNKKWIMQKWKNIVI